MRKVARYGIFDKAIQSRQVKLIESGEDMYYARCQKGMSQLDIGKLIGCSQSQIAKYERCRTFDELSESMKLNRLLQISEILLNL